MCTVQLPFAQIDIYALLYSLQTPNLCLPGRANFVFLNICKNTCQVFIVMRKKVGLETLVFFCCALCVCLRRINSSIKPYSKYPFYKGRSGSAMQPCHRSPRETKGNSSGSYLSPGLKQQDWELQAGVPEPDSLPPPTPSQFTNLWALGLGPYFRDPPTPTPSQSPFLLACLSPTSPTVPSWDCSEFLKSEFQLRLCYPTCHDDQGPLWVWTLKFSDPDRLG